MFSLFKGRALAASVQKSTSEAAKAIEGITAAIDKLKEISSGIAAAVEEQTTVTRDMSANIQITAIGVTSISSGPSEIAAAANNASASSRKVREASQALAR